MKKSKKPFIFSCAIVLSLMTIQSVNAYTTQNIYSSKNHGLNQMQWSENIYPSSKFNNIGNDGVYNGVIENRDGKLYMTRTGRNNTYSTMYWEGYLYHWRDYFGGVDAEKQVNKRYAERTAIQIEGGDLYRLSYEIEGDNHLIQSQPIVFWCDENCECPGWDYNWGQLGKFDIHNGQKTKTEVIFRMPENARWLNFRIDPIFDKNSLTNNDKAIISNVNIQKLIN